MKFGIGQSVLRTEDPRFLKGSGRYVADIAPANLAHGVVVRSPHAHARIKSIDTAAAKAMPGVLAVLTGKDADADKIGTLIATPPIAFGGPAKAYQALHPILVRDRVRHVGDPVAFVVAETMHQARDAAELVKTEYELLPAVIAAENAPKPGAPQIWEGAPNNIWYALERGDKVATEAAFKNAAHVVTLRVHNNRITANSMEPRTTLGDYDPATRKSTLHTSSQMPHKVRATLANSVFREPEMNFRVVAPDVGGGFGMKGGPYPEEAMVVWAARKVHRPVLWVAERSEGLQSDAQARDCTSVASLALDAKGKFIGLKIETDFAQGAYLSSSAGVPSAVGSLAYTNCYEVGAAYVSYRHVYTNTVTMAPYRGAGKPEAVYLMERLVDTAAREMKIDPAELRRRNYIKPASVPYKTPLSAVHDSANYEAVMDRALKIADYDGFAARRKESQKKGKLRGRGVSYFMEIAAPGNDRMEVRFDEGGTVTIVSGTHNHGQGHETVYAQMLVEWLGVEFDKVRMIQGDTDVVGYGRGTFGSRSMTVGGSALKMAADIIVEKGKRMAGHVLEAAATDIQFKDGKFTVVGTDKSLSLPDLCKRCYAPMGWPAEFGVGLEAVGTFTPPRPNFPNGSHVCEVEVDPDTGKVEIVRYTAVDDAGLIINPMLFEAQIHGGIAQGIGQALMENVAIDPNTGQILSGSFQDYAMPRAEDMPYFDLGELGDFCKSNPIGVKGAGESGTVGAPPAIIAAIVDALHDYGVTDIPMPATAARVWAAMRNGKAKAA
jgi:aerobic carbon-monoxide dehydrogenase large subunit